MNKTEVVSRARLPNESPPAAMLLDLESPCGCLLAARRLLTDPNLPCSFPAAAAEGSVFEHRESALPHFSLYLSLNQRRGPDMALVPELVELNKRSL